MGSGTQSVSPVNDITHLFGGLYHPLLRLFIECLCIFYLNLWVILLVDVGIGQHSGTYLHALAKVGFECLCHRVAGIQHIIHQHDDCTLGQLAVVVEIYLWQVIISLLLFERIERGMGRTGQAVITLH